jgi:hypothetical protein
VTFLVFWAYIFPNTGRDIYRSSLYDAFGQDPSLVLIMQLYFLARNILVHCIPLLASLTTTFAADIVYMESDWFNNFEVGVLYVFVNYSVTMYAGTNQVYYLDWGSEKSSLATYKPLIDSFTLGLIASAMHIMMSLIT